MYFDSERNQRIADRLPAPIRDGSTGICGGLHVAISAVWHAETIRQGAPA